MSEILNEKEAGKWPCHSIPKSWCWVPFQRVFANVTSGDKKAQRKHYLSAGKHPIVDQGAEFIGGYTEADDLLLPAAPPFIVFGDHTRCIKYVSFRFVQGADGVKVLKPNGIDAKYANWMLRAIQLPHRSYSRHFRFLRNSVFPIAPLTEQHRIVAKIEELFSQLDAGVAALERVRAGLKRYRAAVFKAAVEGKLTEDWRAQHPHTEPASVLLERILAERRRKWEEAQLAKFAQTGKQPPKGWQLKYQDPTGVETSNLPSLPHSWRWVSVEQIAEDVTVGHVGPMRDQYISNGTPFLRSQNVRPLRYETDGLQYIPDAFHQTLSKSCLIGNELLVVRSGVNVGDACVYPAGGVEANCADLVITRPSPGFNSGFGAIYVNSPPGKAALYLKRTGNAQPHFNIGAMKVKPFPLPPHSEQAEIVARVELAFSIADQVEAQVEANLKRAARLRQGILKRAFEGKLVPQDPSDEPAEQLLGRIRAEGRDGTPRPKAKRERRGPRADR